VRLYRTFAGKETSLVRETGAKKKNLEKEDRGKHLKNSIKGGEQVFRPSSVGYLPLKRRREEKWGSKDQKKASPGQKGRLPGG